MKALTNPINPDISTSETQTRGEKLKKASTYLETAIKNYRISNNDDKVNPRVAFKDTLIGREIIAWQMNIKKSLFDIIQ
jgi:hypothetical protein